MKRHVETSKFRPELRSNLAHALDPDTQEVGKEAAAEFAQGATEEAVDRHATADPYNEEYSVDEFNFADKA